ncbi:MAG: metal-dependent hydrolase [Pirellulaceae bacterium]
MSVSITWIGHATWLFEVAGKRILLDPFFNDNPATQVSADKVVCDLILISHGHYDHIADAVSIAKRTKAPVLAIYEIAQWLSGQGVENTVGMNLGGAFRNALGQFKMTPALHSSVLPDGTYGGSPAGFVLNIGGKRIYAACDTALFSDMQLIGEGGLDLAILPIGDLFTMGPDDSVQATNWLKPNTVLPAHYNTWPPIEQDASVWAQMIRERTAASPVVLKPGESIEI